MPKSIIISKHGGPEVLEMEKKIARFCKRKFCVGTASGTDALYLAVRALDIGKGDEVITSPMTWVSSTNSIIMNNAKPVFVDIKNDLNIDQVNNYFVLGYIFGENRIYSNVKMRILKQMDS